MAVVRLWVKASIAFMIRRLNGSRFHNIIARGVNAVQMTVDARSWLHTFQVVSLGRDNPSRNVDANMSIEYFLEGIHHNTIMVWKSSF